MDSNYFEVMGQISEGTLIASGHSIRDLGRLQRVYGLGRWRKVKGIARVRFFPGGEVVKAELHWYEAHGIGKKELKIKRILE